MPTKTNPKPSELLQQVARYLKYRQRSRLELEKYLARKTQDSKAIIKTLDQLEEMGLVDDQKFAESYAQSKRKKLFGPILIRLQLKSRFGINPTQIRHALDQITPQQWHQAASRYLAKHKTTIAKKGKFKARNNAYQRLYRRGFPQEYILPAIDELGLSE